MHKTDTRHQCIISPGYIAVSEEPAFLCSVCGNGVIVIVWDKLKRTGGMAHCVFPKKSWGKPKNNYQADTAVRQLLGKMMESGASAGHLEAQLFGGGANHGYSAKRAARVKWIITRLLRKFGIEIVSEDFGGTVGRKVMFDTFSGDVIVIKTRKIRQIDWAPEYLLKK